ncbi:MAG TPA: hypothetical protein VI789_08430 [Dehalococcoidia bacterium]|nr:hypothetical protein [Dehalococcoidia bacterium]
MTALAWVGAFVVALVIGILANFLGDSIVDSGWLAATISVVVRTLEWIMSVWILLIVGYPAWQLIRRKSLSTSPFQVLGWSFVIAGIFVGIFGLIIYVQTAADLGGLVGAILSLVFAPIAVFAVAILAKSIDFWVMGVIATACIGIGTRLAAGSSDSY